VTSRAEKQRYLKRLLAISLALTACGGFGLPFAPRGSSFGAGWILAGVVAAAGMWLVIRAAERNGSFLGVLATSLLGKMAVYGLALVLVLGFSLFLREWFVAGLLTGMVVFMALELAVIHRRGRWLLS
jgi:hypothetical protein